MKNTSRHRLLLTLSAGLLLFFGTCVPKGVFGPDPRQMILQKLFDEISQNDGGAHKNSLYSLTKENRISPCTLPFKCSWILQTPNIWGVPAKNVKPNAGRHVLDEMTDAIRNAETFVDITTLSEVTLDSMITSGEFTREIIAAIRSLAENNKTVTIRIMGGTAPIVPYTSARKLLKAIVAEVGPIKTGKLKIYVAAQKVADLSWNHSKIIAVDGSRAIIGGQNLWDVYLGPTPIHDLNVQLQGSSALSMHQFIDTLWGNVCASVNPLYAGRPYYWESGAKDITRACLPKSGVKNVPDSGDVWVLAAGRLGTGPKIAADDVAMLSAFDMAKDSIYISQQSLYVPPFVGFWEKAVTKLGDALARGVKIYYVQSNPLTPDYSGATLKVIGDHLRAAARRSKNNNRTNKELNALLCKNLNLAELRFNNTDDTWPDARGNKRFFGNHAKFFMIDDLLFYVGSRNLYRADLQEFGVFMSDATAVANIKANYWDPLWNFSKRTRVSGAGAASCIF